MVLFALSAVCWQWAAEPPAVAMYVELICAETRPSCGERSNWDTVRGSRSAVCCVPATPVQRSSATQFTVTCVAQLVAACRMWRRNFLGNYLIGAAATHLLSDWLSIAELRLYSFEGDFLGLHNLTQLQLSKCKDVARSILSLLKGGCCCWTAAADCCLLARLLVSTWVA